MLPRCGFTYRCYTSERCTCRKRIGVSQLTIDDWVHLVKNKWIEIEQEAIERFQSTYHHLRHETPFLFIDHAF